MRSCYMVVVNAVCYCLFGHPADVDAIYIVTAFTIGLYGIYFHTGHELRCLPYDNKIFNTSYQHFVHHALSVKSKPYFTGFVFKLWDQLAGSEYYGEELLPALEDERRGNRSFERWEAEVLPNLPDYSVLLSLGFWLEYAQERWLTKWELDVLSFGRVQGKKQG
eukprot:TRINITY_DN2487_c0_g1_i3.p1 TRINITY_DN2487_c0_g1~~TRINITY_DN2487_c0_g1_i3.p1  ORF type:complete len:164 (+),score=19.62 TRINITY_DN2487_c0_g1_i3:629-1120(+)